MSLPFFYASQLHQAGNMVLDETTSRHIIQVLRMKTGESLKLTDGKGSVVSATITLEHKKAAEVLISDHENVPSLKPHLAIAISPVKNNSRFEWFLEKATEIGVNAIIPLICTRTEKQHLKFERMQSILVSAMLQSQQAWLPVLREPVKFKDLIEVKTEGQKFIAHCIDNGKRSLINVTHSDSLILIGPEGDFTEEEVKLALEHGFVPVSLGETRLRTETAGIVAAVKGRG